MLNKTTGLLLIDFQLGLQGPEAGPASAAGYFGTSRNNPDAEEKASQLLQWFRAAQLPVIHVYHTSIEEDSPLRPEQPGFQLHPLLVALPGEPQITKEVNSAFINLGSPPLAERLRAAGISELVVAGLTTDHCVSTSVRMAANLGFPTWLVHDCCATFSKADPLDPATRFDAETIHRSALASLDGEFCRAVSLEDVKGFFELKKARELALQAHGQQKRGPEPYIVHLDEVALILFRHGFRHQLPVLLAGYCHDMVEDTDVTLDDISARFGPFVAETVAQVTDDKQLTAKQRKQHKIDHASELTAAARAVKLADMISNLESLFRAQQAGVLPWSAAELLGYASWCYKLRHLFADSVHPSESSSFSLASLYARFDRIFATFAPTFSFSEEVLSAYYDNIKGSE